MNIYVVRDSGPDLVNNIRYFWIDSNPKIDGDWKDEHLSAKVLLVDEDKKFASFNGKSYRICELGIWEDDDPFIKVWERDPFKDCLPEYMLPLPPDEEAEVDYVI